MKSIMLVPVALGLALATPAMAGTAPPHRPEASIPFADHGGVDNWIAENDHVVWFEDNHRHWYRAELIGSATDLPFTEAIGIDARPGGTLDRFGAIFVKGRRYVFQSFEAMPGPPPKLARHPMKGTPPPAKPG